MKKIVGVEPVSYTSKSGSLVTGVRIFIASDAVAPAVGITTSDAFISGGTMQEYHTGEVQAVLYEPTRGGYSRCVGVIYADAPQKKA